jgi:hypothetical protein
MTTGKADGGPQSAAGNDASALVGGSTGGRSGSTAVTSRDGGGEDSSRTPTLDGASAAEVRNSDGSANAYLQTCAFDTTKSSSCFKYTPPCVASDGLTVCTCDLDRATWRCSSFCPTRSSGGVPSPEKFDCVADDSKCLYSDGTLCLCEDRRQSDPTCKSVSAWNFQRDAGSVDVAVVSPRPACLSDVVSTTCNPATQSYCVMPNGRELCECRNGAWACSVSGCPASPSNQTSCTAGADMMCNSTGSDVCICRASGYFLCGPA